MVNQYGIEISYELGHKINTALYEGDTKLLFVLIAQYLDDNKLEVPEVAKVQVPCKVSGQDKYDDHESGALLR